MVREAYLSEYTHTHVEAKGEPRLLLLRYLVCLFALISLEFAKEAKVAGQGVPEMHLSSSPESRTAGLHQHAQVFRMSSGE